MQPPTDIDLKKDKGLTVRWPDGTTSYYPIAYLRRMSPSADMRQLREEMAANPLTVLPSGPASGPVVATRAELVGNYALRVHFSDGHSTGIYSWVYLRSIDPDRPAQSPSPSETSGQDD
ncbi:MAG: DUF971 domain-containing protein [Phycisphaeraceae bacterium]|nr:DUF971 domain-containing protein [Phycisphaeraceae bacterium]